MKPYSKTRETNMEGRKEKYKAISKVDLALTKPNQQSLIYISFFFLQKRKRKKKSRKRMRRVKSNMTSKHGRIATMMKYKNGHRPLNQRPQLLQ